jgi:hypothetical protein
MIDGDEEVNKVLIMVTPGYSVLGEDERVKHMEGVLHNWDVAKGLWMTEMKIKDQIKRINDLSYLK